MKEDEYSITMHAYFNTVLRLRQDFRHKVEKELAELGYSDITMQMSQILYYIHFMAKNQKSNQQDIANRTGKNKSSVTALIDNLVKKNLISRTMDPDDRRNNVITLTPEGIAFIEEVYDKVYRAFDMSKAGISIHEIKAMTSTMESLIDH